MRTMIICLFILSAIGFPWLAQSQEEQAMLPYATIYKMLTQKLNGSQKQEARFIIESNLPGVKSQDIRLYIDSNNGKIPIKLNADGTFSIPVQDKLLKENPFVVANQPKGTMKLTAIFPIKFDWRFPVEGGSVRYSNLFVSEESFPQIEKEASKMEENVGLKRLNRGRIFEFVPKKQPNGTVTIHSKNGSISIPPDVDGIVRIVYDPLLSKEDPWVDFPAASESWEPNIWLRVEAEPASARGCNH